MVTRSPSYISCAPKATVSFLSFLKVNTCFHCALLFHVCSTFQAVQWWWTSWSQLTLGYRTRLVMRFPMRHSERYWITLHRWVKTEPYKQCRKFWPCTSISEWTLGFLFVLVGHANIQIIPSHLICLSSLAFIGFRRGLSITYCIEEVHECKLRERTDFCEPEQSRQASTRKRMERRGDQTDKQLQGGQSITKWFQTDVRTSVWK